MTTYKFSQVDVFGNSPLKGNPLAVVHGAEGLTTEEMQQFSKWTNLSETTFLLAPTTPEADYRVRIFTPNEEFKFAGHPTLGSAHAWLEAGGQPHTEGYVTQECGIGLVRIKLEDGSQAFAAPDLIRYEPLNPAELDQVTRSLNVPSDAILDSHWIDNGPRFIGVLLRDAQTVLNIEPDFDTMTGLNITVLGAYPDTSLEKANGIDVEVRAFVPETGIWEDPVTGSANAALGQWLTATGHLPDTYTVRQGTVIGYDGKLKITREGETVWVAGSSKTVVTGTVNI